MKFSQELVDKIALRAQSSLKKKEPDIHEIAFKHLTETVALQRDLIERLIVETKETNERIACALETLTKKESPALGQNVIDALLERETKSNECISKAINGLRLAVEAIPHNNHEPNEQLVKIAEEQAKLMVKIADKNSKPQVIVQKQDGTSYDIEVFRDRDNLISELKIRGSH